MSVEKSKQQHVKDLEEKEEELEELRFKMQKKVIYPKSTQTKTNLVLQTDWGDSLLLLYILALRCWKK